MTELNLFELATRRKFKFPSVKGDLRVEDLWDLPLKVTSPTRDVKADLDTVAKGLNAKIKLEGEESFVTPASNVTKTILEQKLDIVKRIIAVKIAERDAAEAKATRDAERKRLLVALDKKQEEAIDSMSAEEIEKRLAALK